jgi:hypothetical protein
MRNRAGSPILATARGDAQGRTAMIMEHRIYTMRPGNVAAFVQAQIDRGFDIMHPLIGNCVGYFDTFAGPADQIVHLWAFDDLEDWRARYNAVYGIPELQPYFLTVRPLMLAQEVKMLVPAPLDALTPLWGGTRDWRAGGAPIGDLEKAPDTIVEERTQSLQPGSLPKYWDAYARHGVDAVANVHDHLIGVFFTLIGPLHQVIHLWRYTDQGERERVQAMLHTNDRWRAFIDEIRPMATGGQTRLTHPIAVPQMSPLFAPR